VLQVWFYVTPVLYSIDAFPAKYRWLFKLNPLIFVLNGFRLSVYYGMLPAAQSVLASFACALASLFIGFAVFRKFQDRFVFYV
jgi:ABC-type polysaccharide/polyol phosphate export permease